MTSYILALFLAFAGMQDRSGPQHAKSGTLITSASDCLTDGACVVMDLEGAPGASVQLSKIFTGTAQFEVTVNGIDWVAVSGTPANSTSGASSATAVGVWQFGTAGFFRLRVRASALASGDIGVYLQQSCCAPRAGLLTGGDIGGATSSRRIAYGDTKANTLITDSAFTFDLSKILNVPGVKLTGLAGAGDLPACLDAAGGVYAGTNTMGVLTCP